MGNEWSLDWAKFGVWGLEVFRIHSSRISSSERPEMSAMAGIG